MRKNCARWKCWSRLRPHEQLGRSVAVHAVRPALISSLVTTGRVPVSDRVDAGNRAPRTRAPQIPSRKSYHWQSVSVHPVIPLTSADTIRAGDGNRNRMTSLEDRWPCTPGDLRGYRSWSPAGECSRVTVADRLSPLCMARMWHAAASVSRLKRLAFQAQRHGLSGISGWGVIPWPGYASPGRRWRRSRGRSCRCRDRDRR